MLPGRVSIVAGTVLALAIPGTAVAGSFPGELDGAFGPSSGLGGGGTLSTDFSAFYEASTSDDRARDIVTYSSGKLVAVGEAEPDGEDEDFALAAYEPSSGATDESDFGRGGLQTTDFAGGDDVARAAALTSDGKLVVAGTADVGTERFAVARYKPNGRLDRSFSDDGRVTTKFPGSEEDFGLDVVVRGNGKITVAGESEPDSGGTLFGLVRYNPDGSRDRSFGGDGRVLTGFPGSEGNNFAQAIVSARRGKVLVAGAAFQTTSLDEDFALARYRRDGSRDPSFDDDGRVTSDFGSPEQLNDVVIEPDGGIIAGGLYASATSDFALVRYGADGEFERADTFNFGGQDFFNALALQPNGKLLAAGVSDQRFALARFLTNGEIDAGFSPDDPGGFVFTDFPSADNNDGAEGITLAGLEQGVGKAARGDNQPQGDPVLAGFTQNGGLSFDFALARYHGN